MSSINFNEAFERIKIVTGTRTQMELAEYCGIRQSSISDAKRRNSIPSEWLVCLVERAGVNPAWIKFGAEPKYLKDPMPEPQAPAPDPSLLSLEEICGELQRRFAETSVTINLFNHH